MKSHNWIWLVGALVAGFLAIGIPFWQVPYAKVSIPTTLMAPGLVAVALGAAVARFIGRSGFLATLVVVALAAPGVVMVRVAVETAQDPTTHNLWPFEVFLAWMVGLLASLAGCIIGSIPAWLARTSRGGAS